MVGTQTSSSAETRFPIFRSEKLFFVSSTVLLRRLRPRRLIRHSSSSMFFVLACEETLGKQRGPFQHQNKRCSSCTYIMHVALWFFAFLIEANMLSSLLGQIVQAEPVLPCNGRGAASSATRRCACSPECLAGFRPQVLSPMKAQAL